MTLGQLIVNDVREQRNHESYPLDHTVTVQSSSSSSHFSFKQQQKPMNHLWWPDVYNTEQLSPLLISQSRHPEHHFCTVCFRILHKYDHNITDVYKNTHLFASIIIFQWLKSMSRDPKQTSELRWLLRTSLQERVTFPGIQKPGRASDMKQTLIWFIKWRKINL